MVSHVNFFSLDVEGGEYDVLSGIDWSKFSFDVMVVEADGGPKDEKVLTLLKTHGYTLHSRTNRNNWVVRDTLGVPTRSLGSGKSSVVHSPLLWRYLMRIFAPSTQL